MLKIQDFEAVARILCETEGRNPDEVVRADPEPKLDRVRDRTAYLVQPGDSMKRWERYAGEFVAFAASLTSGSAPSDT